MTLPHLLNILVHILAGGAAIVVGLYLLLDLPGRWPGTPQGVVRHRKGGRVFVALALAVCGSAAVGNAVFRFIPLFALLTIMVSYQLLSGWHVVHTRAAGPDRVDAGLLLAAMAASAAVLARLSGAEAGAAGPVVAATLGALAALLAYEAARWTFPRRWHARLWRYEHIYKMVASLFGMLSAAAGNGIRIGQPWSQLAPTVIGLAVIVGFWTRNHREQRRVPALPNAQSGQIG